MIKKILYRTLIRGENGLGLCISGIPTDMEAGDDGIYIAKIVINGAAAKDGKLKVGDKIVAINGVEIDGTSQDTAVSLLNGIGRYVSLVVQRHVQQKNEMCFFLKLFVVFFIFFFTILLIVVLSPSKIDEKNLQRDLLLNCSHLLSNVSAMVSVFSGNSDSTISLKL